ncbi:MAG: GNAT family N-acetyltransferase [Azonexus sp.]|jgi:GNAT superfamily N-acetyltransferase|uniref:GNAT family N-acetyltransferase n=1 Tax=Azonexus sp. TaxID=1872668 RepID=UPI00283A5079|nr:GNAT family N-acetyltransferase [Azonexus sp.]MDR0776861.1 GNAT family N-acetyltransferase [Azonexus sp.]
MPIIRDFQRSDAPEVNALALRAFEQFRNAYDDWPAFQAKIANMSSLAGGGEIVVAEVEGQIVGAVAYIGPDAPKAEFFQPEWPIMRMLVVSPASRGLGIGRVLAEECLRRAKRDGASVFALHTSELMPVALPMYQRMGFKWVSNAPAIHGVEYGVYLKELDDQPCTQADGL